MRRFISALIFVLLFSLAAPSFSVAAEAPFNAKESFTENGVEYINVALDKSYVSTGGVYSGTWTDTGGDGKPVGKYTDGVVAVKGDDNAIGCYQSNETSITIDLGKAYAIKRMVTDLYGHAGWGIPDPGQATVSVSVSTDGSNFNDAGNAQMSDEKTDGEWKNRLFTLTLNQTVSARYVRVTYKINGAFCWSSEIAVFGSDKIAQSSESSKPSESSKSSVSSQAAASSKSSVSSQAAANSQSAVNSEDTSSGGEESAENNQIWLYVLIGVVVVAAATAVTAAVLHKRKKNR